MPSFNTLQIIGLCLSGCLCITALILLNCTRKMKTKIIIIDNRIEIEDEIEEKLDLFYNDEFEKFELGKNQRN